MRSAVVISVVAVLVVASLGAGYLAGRGNSRAETLTSISTSTTTATNTTTATVQFPQVPYSGIALYATNADRCSGGYSPCFSSDFRQAYVFTCAKEAATPQGCTVRINATNSISFVQFTIWYPYVNQSAGAPSWANCAFNAPGGSPSQFYAAFPSYCFLVGINGFILTTQQSAVP
jgi:hypothetical protein